MQDFWFAEAETLADKILSHRIKAADGRVTWLAPGLAPSGQIQLRMPLNLHLYNGTAGVALFLASLASVNKAVNYRHACLEILAPLRGLLAGLVANPARAAEKRLGIGGLFGLGGFVYTLLRVGELLQDDALVQEAHATTNLFTLDRIAADTEFDLMGGCAGAILVLLRLHQRLPLVNVNGLTPGDLAEACGRRLVETQDRTTGGWFSANHPGRKPLGGLAHGAAGILYALAHLHHERSDSRWASAIEFSLAFERSLFSPEHGNWLDLRFSYPHYGLGWCHGAPGVALSRIGLNRLTGDSEALDEAQLGLETTCSSPMLELDHLCCGNFGLVAILSWAGEKLQIDSYVQDAESRARAALDRARKRGYLGWTQGQASDAVFDPTLFKGASGVGLTLLRLAGQKSLPNPLLLD